MFTSDNFNKYPEARELLEAMVAERIELPFFVQCDAQIERQEDLVALLARAGCFQMFVGAESFDTEALRAAHKFHNAPEKYGRIVALCRKYAITSHFSNILGFPSDTREGLLEHLRTLRVLAPDVAGKFARFAVDCRDFRRGAALFAIAGYAAQSRLASRLRTHPMTGGTWRVSRDHAQDYAALRRSLFG